MEGYLLGPSPEGRHLGGRSLLLLLLLLLEGCVLRTQSLFQMGVTVTAVDIVPSSHTSMTVTQVTLSEGDHWRGAP